MVRHDTECHARLVTMKPLELLFEREALPRFALPAGLSAMYGGDFGMARSRVLANFVSSVDGVVALPASAESGRIVSGDSEADRFVMALLRACADAVLIGAGTFRKAKGDLWQSENAYPGAAHLFAELRRTLGLRSQPRLVVVTASGQIDTAEPAIQDALIATTPAGEARLRGDVGASTRIVVLDSEPIRLASLLELLRAEGMGCVLTEGGPSLVGQLVKEGLVDELFLTVSPKLFGRQAGDARKPLIDGVDLAGRELELLSARRDGSHLFLRYAVAGASVHVPADERDGGSAFTTSAG
jgi:riboflavin biosynthesis pyrimidine reductase